MRLVSRQHDYYDSLFRYGSGSKKDVFVREEREIVINRKKNSRITFDISTYSLRGNNNVHYDLSFNVLGFCGKIYPYLKINVIGGDTKYIYSYEALAHHFPDITFGHTTLLYRFDYLSLDRIKSWFYEGRNGERFNETDITRNRGLLDIFTKEKCAYFTITHTTPDDIYISIYEPLAKYQFFRLFNVEQAYQEILMYVTNQLVKPDDPYIAPVPDHIKAESHGFDKFSFRKDPSSKKRKL